jgi:DNA-binding CsgD family transcriptional regulator
MRLPQGVVFNRAAVWPDEHFERSVYYNEYIRPMNGFHALAMLHSGPGVRFHLGLCRPKHAGEFDEKAAAGLGSLARHFATAIEFQQRLGSAWQYCAELERVFDHVAGAVILTDAAGRPVFANARAAQLLKQADGLSVGIAGLVASSPKTTRRLRDTIAAVAVENRAMDATLLGTNGRPADEAVRLIVERPSQRPPLRLALLPVWRLGPAVVGTAGPRVAIFMTEPDARPPIDEKALAETFGLRPREAATVALLAAGLGPAEITVKLDIGLGTVRNYLKSAFQKTDTHSQAALVALARGFAVPMAQ